MGVCVKRIGTEYTYNFSIQIYLVKNLILNEELKKVFNFIQFVLRSKRLPSNFGQRIQIALRTGRAAYQLVDDYATITPRSTPEQGAAILQAFDNLKSSGLDGGRAHLGKAANELTAGKYADSVRESIHAVESVARKLDPESAKTLGPALKALERDAAINPALRGGFEKIYGYTNSEKGIRHPLLDESDKVDQEDAVFMIGACASFISYMIGKARSSGLIDK